MTESELLQNISTYQSLVLRYEAVHSTINALMHQHGGGTEHMSEADISQYRALARERDEVLNEMRFLEQLLNIDDLTQ